jgi:hypothetical protein
MEKFMRVIGYKTIDMEKLRSQLKMDKLNIIIIKMVFLINNYHFS